jgi:F-type H+-transporting ATPase subunit epsilon
MPQVIVLTPQRVVFEGQAKSVIVPGENGTFEILAFHKPLLSRLISGWVNIDGEMFFIKRGIVGVMLDAVTMVVEEFL